MVDCENSMAYTSRILPPEEYYKLETVGVPADSLPNPATSIVGVVELDGLIVARWIAMNVIMMEGLKVEEEFRNIPGVARRIVSVMMEELREKGIEAVLTIVQSPEVGCLAMTAGFDPIPGQLYQKDLRRKSHGKGTF